MRVSVELKKGKGIGDSSNSKKGLQFILLKVTAKEKGIESSGDCRKKEIHEAGTDRL